LNESVRRRLRGLILLVCLALCVVTGCGGASPTALPTQRPTPTRTGVPTATSTGQLVLNITEPADESVVEIGRITIRGRTSPDAVVSINGEVADVDATGVFSLEVDLDEGPNVFFIIASDNDGNLQERDLLVSWVP